MDESRRAAGKANKARRVFIDKLADGGGGGGRSSDGGACKSNNRAKCCLQNGLKSWRGKEILFVCLALPRRSRSVVGLFIVSAAAFPLRLTTAVAAAAARRPSSSRTSAPSPDWD